MVINDNRQAPFSPRFLQSEARQKKGGGLDQTFSQPASLKMQVHLSSLVRDRSEHPLF
jgi:hypothetical protein